MGTQYLFLYVRQWTLHDHTGSWCHSTAIRRRQLPHGFSNRPIHITDQDQINQHLPPLSQCKINQRHHSPQWKTHLPLRLPRNSPSLHKPLPPAVSRQTKPQIMVPLVLFFTHTIDTHHYDATTPLAKMAKNRTIQSNNWHSYYDPASSILYVWETNKYRAYKCTWKQISLTQPTMLTPLPSATVPAAYQYIDESNAHLKDWQPRIPPEPDPTTLSFPEYIDNLTTWESSLIGNTTLIQDAITSADKLTTQPILLFSDGSVTTGLGSFGWLCKTQSGNSIAHNNSPVSGYHPSLFRAEATGMLSGLYFIQQILSYTKATTPLQLHVYSDSKSLIQRVNDHRDYNYYFPNTTISSDWDVTQSIVTIANSLPGESTFYHVKGHQDTTTPYHDLPLEAQMNVKADHLTSEFDVNNSSPPYHALLPSQCNAHIYVNSRTITSNYHRTLRKLISSRSL